MVINPDIILVAIFWIVHVRNKDLWIKWLVHGMSIECLALRCLARNILKLETQHL